MMVLSSRRPDASLVEYAESHARGAPLRILITHTVIAVAVGLAGFGLPLPGKQIIMPFALAYFSYGAWGLLDRGRSRSIELGRQLRARYLGMLCAFFVALGVLAGVALLFALSFRLLGSPWIL